MPAPKLIKTAGAVRLYEDEKGGPLLRLTDVRGSYLYPGTPSKDENEDGKIVLKNRGTFMLPKSDEAGYKLIIDTIEALVGKQKGKEGAAVKVAKANYFITDGDEKEDVNMHGHWLINASDGKHRPTSRTRQGTVIDDVAEIDKLFYGGCYVTAVIRPWFFDGTVKGNPKTFPKRVPAGFVSIMFMKDGKPFGSSRIDDSSMYDGIDGVEAGDDGLGNPDNDADEI